MHLGAAAGHEARASCDCQWHCHVSLEWQGCWSTFAGPAWSCLQQEHDVIDDSPTSEMADAIEADAQERALARKTSDDSSADLLRIELSQALTAEESWAAYLLRTERFFSRWG